MEQHPLYWSLPPSGEELVWVEKEDGATRQRSTRRLFTVSRESRVQKRTDLELRLEFQSPWETGGIPISQYKVLWKEVDEDSLDICAHASACIPGKVS